MQPPRPFTDAALRLARVFPERHNQRTMNKIAGSGHFRSDSTQNLTRSVMALDAVSRIASDDPSARVISITIHEKLPLMNGLGGCDAEIQITPDQASRFAQLILELVGHAAPASLPHEKKAKTPPTTP
jgi:hypothetical protein